MADSSSSGSQTCDVFPSFRGEDVRTGFLSHLREALDRSGSINTFKDHGIERSRPIGPELLSAIREARISIVIFSKNYASSKWCLDELAEIHKCFKESNQMVIPVFYDVDPSEVRKQSGEFGKFFDETCKGKPDDMVQRWKEALTDVADLAGEHLKNWSDEASMVKKIANDVFHKLLPQSNGFGDFVGIEDHIKAMESILCLESEESRMIGIWGQSGIGKSTLGRALFGHLSPKFPLHAFVTYKSTDEDVFGMKLRWEKQLLVEIFKKNIEVDRLGMVERMLKPKKVLIVLDDVFQLFFLETLVGKTEWFGPGSRIIVISQDKHLLEAHKIDDLYEVKIPAPVIARKMLCRSAFDQDSPPEGFKELAAEVAKVAGNLPLGLRVLGSSLKGRTKEEWMEVLQNGLEEDIMKVLRVSYNRLKEKDRCIFLWIASVFNGRSVKSINDFFGDGNFGLKRLAEKSLIRIIECEDECEYECEYECGDEWEDVFYEELFVEVDPKKKKKKVVEMHNLLEKLGREIDRVESKGNPGQRRFLTEAKEIEDVFTHQSGTETVLGIDIRIDDLPESSFPIDEKSFQGISNLQFLSIDSLYPCSCNMVYLPPKLKYLDWRYCPLMCLPSNFKAEFLVELRMEESEFEKLWEGTQQLGSLKTIRMNGSYYLKEIPDLSKAINLESVDFSGCANLESFPNPLNWESLEYLNLFGCFELKNFPQIKMESLPHGIEISVDDCLWNKNLPGLDYLDCLRRCYPLKFLPEHIVQLNLKGFTMEKLWEGVQSLGILRKINLSKSKKLKEIPDLSKATNLTYLYLKGCTKLEKLWKGVQSLGNLQKMDLSESENLKEIPNLSKATNLTYLDLSYCKSLVTLPSTIGNLQKLKDFPVDVNLSSLRILKLNGCSSLKNFPQISHSIEELYLDDTAIEEIPCFIEMFRKLTQLYMRGCSKLKNISPKIFKLTNLQVNFTDCGGVITVLSDATIKDPYETIENGNKVDKVKYADVLYYPYFNFVNCLKLDNDARELIIQSSLKSNVILPGGEVPIYFNHRAFGNSLTVTLPQSSLSHHFLRFSVCVVVDPVTDCLSTLYLHVRFDGLIYRHEVFLDCSGMSKNHMVLFSFKSQPTGLPSKLDSNDVEFKFESVWGNIEIKEVGIRLLNVFPSPDDRDGRSTETECNNQSAEKCDVVETNNKKKRKQMTSPNLELRLGKGESSSVSSRGFHDSMITVQQDAQLPMARLDLEPGLIWTSSCSANSEENPNLPFDQILTDTRLISPNLELPLGRGESSSVSSYPCPQREVLFIDYMNTEQQDAQTPIVENFNLPCGQITTVTTLTSPNLELTLGWGDSSSFSSYPCLEGEAFCIDSMVTKHQDAQLPIVDPEPDLTWQPSSNLNKFNKLDKFRKLNKFRKLCKFGKLGKLSKFGKLSKLNKFGRFSKSIKRIRKKKRNLLKSPTLEHDNVCNFSFS